MAVEPQPGQPVVELLPPRPHPSSILRAPDDEFRRDEMRAFVADLRKIAKKIGALRPE